MTALFGGNGWRRADFDDGDGPPITDMTFDAAWAMMQNYGGGDGLAGMEDFYQEWFVYGGRDFDTDHVTAYNTVGAMVSDTVNLTRVTAAG